jgi:uncharacterized protein YkwD
VVLAIAVAWLFLLLLALAILRTAGAAERAAEQRLRETRDGPHFRRTSGEHSRRTVPIAVVTAGLTLAGLALLADDADAQSCRGARSAPGAHAPSITLCVINAERRSRGLAPLAANARLARAAQRHARDMVARAYFSHVSLSGRSFADRLRAVNYARGCAWSGGETLAWGTGRAASPASRVAAWLRSPPHRAILLNSGFREAGIGIALGAPGDARAGATYVGEFGRRRC